MITTLNGDCREVLQTLPAGSVQCVVTSPPYYGLRKYSDDPREIGQEATPALYVAALVEVFRQLRRALRDDGTVWLNLGDSYAANRTYQVPDSKHRDVGNGGAMRVPEGMKEKDLMGIPWRVAFALQDDGWYLRSDIIWNKPNCMPESVTDRPTRAHEYVFLLTKSARYFYDAAAVAEAAIYVGDNRAARTDNTQENGRGGDDSRKRTGKPTGTTRNRRTVWTIATQPYSGAHYATMPESLIAPCILAGSSAQACEHCGAAWVRQSEPTGHVNTREPAHQPGNTATKVDSTGWAPTTRSTDRFTPACACPANTGSAASVVLDPFGGSGTVGKVALRYQRNAVLIELNQAYIDDHIETRTDKVQTEMFV